MTTLSGFGSLAAIPEEKITDKITRRMFAGQKGMMVWWKIGAGTHVAAHSHPHEQLVWVVKGRMDFRIDKERSCLKLAASRRSPAASSTRGGARRTPRWSTYLHRRARIFWPAASRLGYAKKAKCFEVSASSPKQSY